MTNAEIIMITKTALYDAGILKGTGRMLEAKDAEGNPIEIPEIEDIHTFAAWQRLGYKVKKGEHAVAKFAIWKHFSKKVEVEDGDGDTKTIDKGRMFLKDAFWFTRAQVEVIA